MRHPLMESAFIELIIRLRDLVYKCEKLGNRIEFNDDIIILRGKNSKEIVKDVTDAIICMRGATCHIESDKNLFNDNIIFSFNIAYGKVNIIATPNKKLSLDYEDDACFFSGEQKLYLKRHIVRAFEEARNFLK